jgi:hypothetical protein
LCVVHHGQVSPIRLPDDPTKFSNRWKYIELAAWQYSKKQDRWSVFRDQTYTGPDTPGTPNIYEWSDVQAYADKHSNTGIYTTVFNYDSRDIDRASRLGSLYFDLDSAEDEPTLRDLRKLVGFFLEFIPEEALRIYFTGKKGFHIEVEALAIGITGSNKLPGVFRFIANDLKQRLSLDTLDFQVYDLRRMWRLPNSLHQGTGLYKRLISPADTELDMDSLRQMARVPSVYEVPEQQFCAKGNAWYREYTYDFEEAEKPREYSPGEALEAFRKHGTSKLRAAGEREFDPIDLFDNCSAIHNLWKKAETEHHLEHEERLFLCSILTYTDEAIYYLHEILRNTSDYNYEKSQAHIDDWIRRRERGIGGRPFSCDRANSVGIGCGDCNLEARKKWVKMGDSWVETEEESLPSPIRFAYHSKPNR